MPVALDMAPSLAPAGETVVPPGLLDAVAQVPDPRDHRHVRFSLATLLAMGRVRHDQRGHNSLTAAGEWVHRCDQDVLARLGCPYDPFSGHFRPPGERTPWDVFARVDPGALTAASFARLTVLAPRAAGALSPDGIPEREQRRVHRAAAVPNRPNRDGRAAGLRRGRVSVCAERSGKAAAGRSC